MSAYTLLKSLLSHFLYQWASDFPSGLIQPYLNHLNSTFRHLSRCLTLQLLPFAQIPVIFLEPTCFLHSDLQLHTSLPGLSRRTQAHKVVLLHVNTFTMHPRPPLPTLLHPRIHLVNEITQLHGIEILDKWAKFSPLLLSHHGCFSISLALVTRLLQHSWLGFLRRIRTSHCIFLASHQPKLLRMPASCEKRMSFAYTVPSPKFSCFVPPPPHTHKWP